MTSSVLVVDNQLMILELVTSSLRQAGFEVSTAVNGQGAVTAAARKPGAIVASPTLPDMGGIELRRRLRDAGYRGPVLFLVAREDLDMIEKMGLGANDYIIRPFVPRDLVARVKSAMARGAGRQERKLKASPARNAPPDQRTSAVSPEGHHTGKRRRRPQAKS